MEDLPALRGERVAAAVLHRLPVLGAAFVLSCALAAAVLVPFGLWRPWVALPVVLGVMLGVMLAGTTLAARRVAPLPAAPVPVWSFTLSGLAALGYVVWAAATHAEQVVVRRDAGSYALFGQWLASRGKLPVDVSLAAFGGPSALGDPHLGFGSAGFYGLRDGVGGDVGSLDAAAWVVPQFFIGAPANLSVGWWLGQSFPGEGWAQGWAGMFLVPAVVGGLAVLALASLTTRVVGARWAPLPACALALAQPMVHAGRATYSEPFALLLILVVARLLYDAVAAGGASAGPAGSASLARSAGFAAGLGAGLTGLVRVDMLRELTLLLPVIAVLWLARHPAAGGLLRGLVLGSAVSVTAAALLAAPYLRDIAGSLVPLGVLVVLIAAASAATVRWWPRWPRRLPPKWPRGPAWLPAAAGSAVLAGGLLLAARPLFLTVRQDPGDPGSRVVASLQAAQGLAVDGGRTYAEHSVQWLVWYLGPVTPVLALLAAAEATRRAVAWWRTGHESRQPVPAWASLLFVGGLSTAAVLWYPAITPDHPWADRRLVPVVLPFVLVCATATVAWATRGARRRLPATLLVVIGAGGVAAMLVPAAVATWPVAGQRTERGQPEAVRRVCAALRPGDAVIMVDVRAATEWTQTVRGVCGVPAAVLRLSEAERQLPKLATVSAAVPALAERVAAAGRRPVLMTAQDPTPLLALGLEPRKVLQALSNEDPKLLTRRPDGDSPLPLNVWLAPWDATKRAPTR